MGWLDDLLGTIGSTVGNFLGDVGNFAGEQLGNAGEAVGSEMGNAGQAVGNAFDSWTPPNQSYGQYYGGQSYNAPSAPEPIPYSPYQSLMDQYSNPNYSPPQPEAQPQQQNWWDQLPGAAAVQDWADSFTTPSGREEYAKNVEPYSTEAAWLARNPSYVSDYWGQTGDVFGTLGRASEYGLNTLNAGWEETMKRENLMRSRMVKNPNGVGYSFMTPEETEWLGRATLGDPAVSLVNAPDLREALHTAYLSGQTPEQAKKDIWEPSKSGLFETMPELTNPVQNIMKIPLLDTAIAKGLGAIGKKLETPLMAVQKAADEVSNAIGRLGDEWIANDLTNNIQDMGTMVSDVLQNNEAILPAIGSQLKEGQPLLKALKMVTTMPKKVSFDVARYADPETGKFTAEGVRDMTAALNDTLRGKMMDAQGLTINPWKTSEKTTPVLAGMWSFNAWVKRQTGALFLPLRPQYILSNLNSNVVTTAQAGFLNPSTPGRVLAKYDKMQGYSTSGVLAHKLIAEEIAGREVLNAAGVRKGAYIEKVPGVKGTADFFTHVNNYFEQGMKFTVHNSATLQHVNQTMPDIVAGLVQRDARFAPLEDRLASSIELGSSKKIFADLKAKAPMFPMPQEATAELRQLPSSTQPIVRQMITEDPTVKTVQQAIKKIEKFGRQAEAQAQKLTPTLERATTVGQTTAKHPAAEVLANLQTADDEWLHTFATEFETNHMPKDAIGHQQTIDTIDKTIRGAINDLAKPLNVNIGFKRTFHVFMGSGEEVSENQIAKAAYYIERARNVHGVNLTGLDWALKIGPSRELILKANVLPYEYGLHPIHLERIKAKYPENWQQKAAEARAAKTGKVAPTVEPKPTAGAVKYERAAPVAGEPAGQVMSQMSVPPDVYDVMAHEAKAGRTGNSFVANPPTEVRRWMGANNLISSDVEEIYMRVWAETRSAAAPTRHAQTLDEFFGDTPEAKMQQLAEVAPPDIKAMLEQTPVQADVDATITALHRVEGLVKDSAPVPAGALTKAEIAEMEQTFLDLQRKAIADSERFGDQKVTWVARDYRMRNKIDNVLDTFVPYHYWFTRNAIFQITWAAENPGQAIAGIRAFKAWWDSNLDLPVSQRFTIQLGEVNGTEVRANPINMFMPFVNQATTLFEEIAPENPRDKGIWDEIQAGDWVAAGKSAYNVFDRGVGVGPNVGIKTGVRVGQRLAEAGILGDQAKGASQQWLGNVADASYPMFQQEELLKAALEKAGIHFPNLVQKVLYGTDLTVSQRYEIANILAGKVRSGELSMQAAAKALDQQDGNPTFDAIRSEVIQRAGTTQAVRYMGAPIITSSEDKQAAMGLTAQYNALPKGSDERVALMEANPELKLGWNALGTPSELTGFNVNVQYWGSILAGAEKKALNDKLKVVAPEAFVKNADNDGLHFDTTKIAPENLGAVNRIVNEAAAARPNGLSPEEQAKAQEFATAENEYWNMGTPEQQQMSKEYSALPKGSQERKDYLKANPDLIALWDQQDQYKVDHPILTQLAPDSYTAPTTATTKGGSVSTGYTKGGGYSTGGGSKSPNTYTSTTSSTTKAKSTFFTRYNTLTSAEKAAAKADPVVQAVLSPGFDQPPTEMSYLLAYNQLAVVHSSAAEQAAKDLNNPKVGQARTAFWTALTQMPAQVRTTMLTDPLLAAVVKKGYAGYVPAEVYLDAFYRARFLATGEPAPQGNYMTDVWMQTYGVVKPTGGGGGGKRRTSYRSSSRRSGGGVPYFSHSSYTFQGPRYNYRGR